MAYHLNGTRESEERRNRKRREKKADWCATADPIGQPFSPLFPANPLTIPAPTFPPADTLLSLPRNRRFTYARRRSSMPRGFGKQWSNYLSLICKNLFNGATNRQGKVSLLKEEIITAIRILNLIIFSAVSSLFLRCSFSILR